MLSSRAFFQVQSAISWEEIWEAGPYYDRFSELTEDSKSYAIFTGWQIDSRLKLRKPFRSGGSDPASFLVEYESLAEKMIRICEERPEFQFYLLYWDHSYLYLLEREAWQGRVWDNIHPRIHFVFDNRHPWGGAHHEKICVFDGTVALCGGIDLCGDRWDSPFHFYRDPRRSLNQEQEKHGPYHDLAIQVTGPVCGTLQEEVGRRWRTISSVSFPSLPSFGGLRHQEVQDTGHRVYVSRTCSGLAPFFRPTAFTREIEFLFRDLIFMAERRIILEGQYFWSEVFNDLLIAKIQKMRGKKFEVILILAELENIKSFTKFMSAYQLELLQRLKNAAEFAGISLRMGSPFVSSSERGSGESARPVYIHSKVILIDDRFLGIGSANFAARAFRIDTEIQLTFEARTLQERLHLRRFAHQLLNHWNIDKPSNFGRTFFLGCYPVRDRDHLRGNLRWIKNLPCQILYDPQFPWLFWLKRKYQQAITRDSSLLLLSVIQILGLSTALCLSVVTLGTKDQHASLLALVCYSAVMSAAWLIPLPFFCVCILATVVFGEETGIALSIWTLWISSMTGYGVARAFPDLVARYCLPIGKNQLFRQLGRRDFSEFLKVVLHPFFCLQSKVISQGLACTPFPWFLLATGFILPSFLYFTLFWLVCPLVEGTSGSFVQLLREHSVFILCIITLFSIRKSVLLNGEGKTKNRFL